MQIELFPGHGWVYEKVFEQSELGKLRKKLPLKALALEIDKKRRNSGRKPILSTEGKLALMVLKSYLGLSDKKLVAQLNSNCMVRIFCGLSPVVKEWIRDEDLPSHTRVWLARRLDWEKFDRLCACYWEADLEAKHLSLMDATCYESNVRYPTDEKLLYESTEWLSLKIKDLCKATKTRQPRTNWKRVSDSYQIYARLKKKTYKKGRRLRGRLLRLLSQQLDALDNLPARFWPVRDEGRLLVIRQVLIQQQLHLRDAKAKIENRIVSLAKPYLRPIVRGKENKRVEFGLKAHLWQVGGINFVDLLTPNAFHEGNRLKAVVRKHRDQFGECSHVSGDKIYATNANRKWCSSQGITTNFIRKGRAAKNEKLRQQARNLLNKLRSTRLEGSFGTEKEHYGLKKIKARTLPTEILWIRFGIFTANAMRLVRQTARAA